MAYEFEDGELLTAAKVNEHLVNKPETKAGSFPVSSGSGGINVNVTFDEPFDVTPIVIPGVDHPNLKDPRITSRSTSGFTFRTDRSGAGSYNGYWIAREPTQ